LRSPGSAPLQIEPFFVELAQLVNID